MVNQNANALIELNDTEDSKIDLDDLEAILQANLEEELADAEFIDSEIAKVGNPESLGKVVYDTIWEQLQNQIGVKAGEDFIKDNHGLNLDLRSSEHIQTTENFEKGKIATHNHDIDYRAPLKTQFLSSFSSANQYLRKFCVFLFALFFIVPIFAFASFCLFP